MEPDTESKLPVEVQRYFGVLASLFTLVSWIGAKMGSGYSAYGKAVAAMRGLLEEPAIFDMNGRIRTFCERAGSIASFELVADGADRGSALLGQALLSKYGKRFCLVTDSEDWCHVQNQALGPERIGTVFLCDRNSPNSRRLMETVEQACYIGRPVLLIADGMERADALGEELRTGQLTVCPAPRTDARTLPLRTLVNWIPFFCLARELCGEEKDSAWRMIPGRRGEEDVWQSICVWAGSV